jgi:diaminobutyrate acetyltransferase
MPRLRKPVAADGVAIWELVKACEPLDENSLYCNLIQAEHFRDTCVLAEIGGDVVGWVSGYMIPGRGELFVWQVAVSPKARGIGLGRAMLLDLIKRDACGKRQSPGITLLPGLCSAAWPAALVPRCRRRRISNVTRISRAVTTPSTW